MPVVLDVVDLWPESVVASGMARSPLLFRVLKADGKSWSSHARHVSVVTEGFRQNLIALGVPESKLGVIHNWMPSETYRLEAPDSTVAAREGLAGRFNVMYAGNMGAPQDLGTVLNAAELLLDVPAVQFVLVGDGVQAADLERSAIARGLTNVRFLGRRLPATMPSLYTHADALLVHLRPDPLADVSIPSKVFAYLACGKPVLVAVRGDAETFVRQGNFGLAVPPSDPAALASAVRRLLEMSPGKRAQMGAAATRLHREQFSSEVQTARFEAVLARVAGMRPPTALASQHRTRAVKELVSQCPPTTQVVL